MVCKKSLLIQELAEALVEARRAWVACQESNLLCSITQTRASGHRYSCTAPVLVPCNSVPVGTVSSELSAIPVLIVYYFDLVD